MKHCPECRSELPDDAVACPHCGGTWQGDGSFQTPWGVEMARQTAERQRKVEAAERFGRLGRPLPHWFLDSRSGCGTITLVAVAIVLATLVIIVAAA